MTDDEKAEAATRVARQLAETFDNLEFGDDGLTIKAVEATFATSPTDWLTVRIRPQGILDTDNADHPGMTVEEREGGL